MMNWTKWNMRCSLVEPNVVKFRLRDVNQVLCRTPMKMLSQSGKNETGSDSVYRMSCPAEFSLL